ncbi:MAG TPA: DUF5996 family protein [Gemmatimonadales bacterium]|nr:DUF5996 family protein [Gemmatimonadales bacterium]
MTSAWPALPLGEWQDTYATLHLLTQIVGKTRLALAPPQNHWWHVTLYLTSRGLTTSPMPYRDRNVEIEFDFIDQQLVGRTSDGLVRTLPLVAQPVAEVYRAYRKLLDALGISVHIWTRPQESAGTIPFEQDTTHTAYDGAAAARCWRVLAEADRLLKQFRGRFLGKSSPSHFWWGSFDLACTRFSGAKAPPHPGGIPNLSDRVTREAYSHACISAGFWPGSMGTPVAEPAFYAYAYPEPAGCAEAPISPGTGRYDVNFREWILPYDAARATPDPRQTVLDFFESTYETAARLAQWDRALERSA